MAYVKLLGGVVVAAGGSYIALNTVFKRNTTGYPSAETAISLGEKLTPLPTRKTQLQTLKESSEYDVLVIGGGATGCGVALDAVTRGLTTALVEKDDFASGTSSRSTKLIHGGVRYLQKAVFNLDYEQRQNGKLFKQNERRKKHNLYKTKKYAVLKINTQTKI